MLKRVPEDFEGPGHPVHFAVFAIVHLLMFFDHISKTVKWILMPPASTFLKTMLALHIYVMFLGAVADNPDIQGLLEKSFGNNTAWIESAVSFIRLDELRWDISFAVALVNTTIWAWEVAAIFTTTSSWRATVYERMVVHAM
ncbi:hypothetical protein LTR37_014981 [Vermiconidia calcicola]|uniref:Uncharacterized protein n=1 Tax=Vermiconidia calcicola TaxID=1690605 RepID=A0ACC3MS32_9PEZI|nr:hypothetical protein LTR37_014981 [Vermiconidia calcicola]